MFLGTQFYKHERLEPRSPFPPSNVANSLSAITVVANVHHAVKGELCLFALYGGPLLPLDSPLHTARPGSKR
jgi:hypothetical protein